MKTQMSEAFTLLTLQSFSGDRVFVIPFDEPTDLGGYWEWLIFRDAGARTAYLRAAQRHLVDYVCVATASQLRPDALAALQLRNGNVLKNAKHCFISSVAMQRPIFEGLVGAWNEYEVADKSLSSVDYDRVVRRIDVKLDAKVDWAD